ncbi:hypothetical protein [Ralstonia sp. NFACC01]|uniref:hypothetical protein n=1 Tax=Ralstonia sp. NFACC01 TaxID=1566294 RepID=UPI0008E6395C|nr:hypothetical protein [Ralstonia sp. NFACC01]SFQ19681.1 hypothetical protein SAMN03159417_04579 [Ralstonia sp. NFACC01]
MSLFKHKEFVLTVSQTDLGLWAPTGHGDEQAELLQSVDLQPGPYERALRTGLMSIGPTVLPRYARVSIVVSSPLVRLFLVTPPSNATGIDDLKGAASLRFSTLYGLKPEDWHIAAAWDSRHPFLAAGVRGTLLDALTGFVGARKLRVQRIAAAPLEVWRRDVDVLSPSSESWLVSRQGTAVTLLVCDKRRVHAIRSVQWPDEIWQSVSALHEAVQVEAMRLDRQAPRVAYGRGDIPPELEKSASPEMAFQVSKRPRRITVWQYLPSFDIDFRLGPTVRAKVTRSSFAACVAMLLCIGIVAVESVHTGMQRTQIESRTASVRARMAARQKPITNETSLPIRADQAASVNKAISQLNLPWRQLLQDVEASTPKEIALLSIEPDAKRNVLKGTAEAPDSAGMLAYLTQLRSRGHFESVLLTRHELNEQDSMHPLRFQFEANWSEVRK